MLQILSGARAVILRRAQDLWDRLAHTFQQRLGLNPCRFACFVNPPSLPPNMMARVKRLVVEYKLTSITPTRQLIIPSPPDQTVYRSGRRQSAKVPEGCHAKHYYYQTHNSFIHHLQLSPPLVCHPSLQLIALAALICTSGESLLMEGGWSLLRPSTCHSLIQSMRGPAHQSSYHLSIEIEHLIRVLQMRQCPILAWQSAYFVATMNFLVQFYL